MRFEPGIALGTVATVIIVAIPAESAKADSFRNDQWYLKSLRVPEAHELSKGSGVTIGVIDTGTFPHPDLKRNLLRGIDLTSGKDGGQTDLVGHGTNVAGIVAAHGKNSRDGVLGIAPAAKILPIKVSNDKNNAPAQLIADGVRWAEARGASVLNISAATSPAFELIDAIDSALDNDAVVVAGVGNVSAEAVVAYPAAIDGVLAVGATDRSGNHADLSTMGKRVQICAPGVDITTAEPKTKYADVDGTSMSTAIVSGAAALVRSRFPQLSAEEVTHRLTATADDIGPPGRDDECGFGRLNLIKALTADVPPLEGSSNSQPTPSAPASTSKPPASTPSSNAAAPDTDPASSNSPILFGALAALLGAGSVLAYFLLRRRRRSP